MKHDLGFSYFGAIVDYSIKPKKLVYLDAGLILGPGQAWVLTRGTTDDRSYVDFVIVEPELSVMVNVTHELRLGLGATWRFCGGNDLEGALGQSLDGASINFIMMYGKI